MKLAYILLWFPLASETFIFREVEELREKGLCIDIFTLYGKSLKGCSQKMLAYNGKITRFGWSASLKILRAFAKNIYKQPRTVWKLMSRGVFKPMRNMETRLENLWAFMAGFLLAEKCMGENIELIHAPWANGPATAAWVASHLTGIPFAFTGRAGDIYPPDGILEEKIKDALFVRVNNEANINYLRSFCPSQDKNKIALVYNGLSFNQNECQIIDRSNNFKILAIGRFARTKGFPDLLTAVARLRRENVPVELTLVGDGFLRGKLQRLCRRLRITEYVKMPGFVPNDRIKDLMKNHALLVMPSVVHTNGDRDGIPNVIMEALSQNLPVVATDVCGISEVVENGKTGYLTPQKNPAALAGAIRKILENPHEAARMAQTGCEKVRNMFNPQKNAASLKNLYETSVKTVNFHV